MCYGFIHRLFGSFVFMIGLVLIPTLVIAQTPEEIPTTIEPFSASPEKLQALVSSNSANHYDSEVLLSRIDCQIDSSRRSTCRAHHIARVHTATGVEEWAGLSATYLPSYENRPEIRGRVVDKHGQVFELDPNTIIETAAKSARDRVFSDRRRIEGPLPGVSPGAIIEALITTSETRPLFPAGVTSQHIFYPTNFTATHIFAITAPKDLPLQWESAGGLPVGAESLVGDTRTVTVVLRDQLPWTFLPPDIPPDVFPFPTFTYSTGKSWQDIATSYGKVVDQQLDGYDAAALVSKLVSKTDSRQEKITKLVRFVYSDVRYTSLSIEGNMLAPNPPAEVLKRGYGDCKDKSALLVALFRAAGVSAHVALVRSGSDTDTSPHLPGMGLFNHAIVYVPGAEPLWIDGTAGTTALGDLPFSIQDRWALICEPNSTGLVKIPRADARQSEVLRHVTVRFPNYGKSEMTEKYQFTGSVALEAQPMFSGMSQNEIDQMATRVATNDYGGKLLKASVVANIDAPIYTEVHINQSNHYVAGRMGGSLSVVPRGLMAYVSEQLYTSPPSPDDTVHKPRPGHIDPPGFGVYNATPATARYRMDIHLSPGFVFRQPAGDLHQNVEGIELFRTVTQHNDQHMTVDYQVSANFRVIAPEKVASVQEQVVGFLKDIDLTVEFDYAAMAALDQGNVQQSMQLHRDLLKQTPADPMALVRYAESLVHAGFGTEARKITSELVKKHPTFAMAHWVAGFVFASDEWGQDTTSIDDLRAAATALRRARELDPESIDPLHTLVFVLSRLVQMEDSPSEGLVSEFLKEATLLRDDGSEMGFDEPMLIALIWQKRYAEAIKIAETATPSDYQAAAWVAAIGGLRGGSAAKRKAQQLAKGDPEGILRSAVGVALSNRNYDLAGLLLAEASGDWWKPVKVALQCVRDRQEKAIHTDPAALALVDSLKTLTHSAYSEATILEELAKPEWKHSRKWVWMGYARGLRQTMAENFAYRIQWNYFADALACMFQYDVTRDKGVVIATMGSNHAHLENEQRTSYLLRLTNSGYRLIGLLDPDGSGPRSTFAHGGMSALADNEVDEARGWLNRALAAEANPAIWVDRTVALLWPHGIQNASTDELVLLAYLLSGDSDFDKEDTAVVLQILNGLGEQSADQQMRRGLMMAHVALVPESDPAKTVEVLRQLAVETPKDTSVVARLTGALLRTDHTEDVPPLLDVLRTGWGEDDESYVGWVNQYEEKSGQYDSALQRVKDRISTGKATASEINNVAWRALFTDPKYFQEAIQMMEKLCRSKCHANHRHTLAHLYAETGQYNKAHQTLTQVVAQRTVGQVASADLCTKARIAEGIGLVDAAREMYRQVIAASPDDLDMRKLVQGRMNGLSRKR